MGLDYYWILSVKDNCTLTEINNAYRTLAIGVLNCKEERITDSKQVLVAEAFDVLSSPFTRAVYDRVGEEGLKAGLLGPPYIFHGDPLKTAETYFGSLNNFTEISTYFKNALPMLNCPFGEGIKEKSHPITYDLLLTLEEVFFGGIKIIRIQRLDYGEATNDLRLCEKPLNVPIIRGIKVNTRIVFKEQGDKTPTNIPADIVVIVKQRDHHTFHRSGSNLVLEKQVPLQDALYGTILTVKTLDSRLIHLQMAPGMGPIITKVVEGEGLPIPGSKNSRGDLVIRVSVVLPSNLSAAVRTQLKYALKETRTPLNKVTHNKN